MTEIRMATKRQCWALFCITKTDYRNDTSLTYDQASDLIAELGDKMYVSKNKKKVVNNEAVAIMNEAEVAGMTALLKTIPTPMIVAEHRNMLDDNSPIEKQYYVPSGVCGFAWVSLKANTTSNRRFLADLKRAGMVGDCGKWSKSSSGGFSYWVSDGGQSIEKKVAFARAFANVLGSHNLTVYVQDRMD